MRKILLLGLLSVAIVSCKKENTRWETGWNAPLINDTLSLANWVNDSTLIESEGFYHLNLRRPLFDIDINDVIAIPDTLIDDSYIIPFPLITVEPGQMFINEQKEFDLPIPDAEIRRVGLRNGLIDFTIKNPTETKMTFKVDILGAEKDGVPFSRNFIAPAASGANPGVLVETIDLSGYLIDLTGLDGQQRNMLSTRTQISSDPDGPTVTMTLGDVADYAMDMHDFELNYALGYFGNVTISDTISVYLSSLDIVESGSIDFPASTVRFEVENGIKVAGSVMLSSVKNINNQNNTVSLMHPQLGIPFTINQALGSWGTLTPSVSLIEFNADNSNIEPFLENMGANYEVNYAIELNPWGNTSSGSDELFPDSRLRINLEAEMPLTIGADQLVLADTFAVDLSQPGSGVTIKNGELIVNASNAYPFSADITLYLADANYNVLHTIQGTERIQSGQLGAMNADSLLVSDSEVSFVIPAEAAGDLEQVKNIIVRAGFNTIDPATSTVQSMGIPIGAFLALKLRARLITENQF